MLKSYLRKYLVHKIVKAFGDSEIYIGKEMNRYGKNNVKILDVGCLDGVVTMKILKYFDYQYVLYGVDMVEKKLIDKSVKYTKSFFDNKPLPYKKNSFDLILCNQVIEHIVHKDLLISECRRVLKNGGVCFMATENIASIDNILSLIFGQDPISQHTSNRYHIGSFLSPHFMEKMLVFKGDYHMGHKNVCSYFGIQRLFKSSGFKNVKIKSFGHLLGLFERILPFQNRIIVVTATK